MQTVEDALKLTIQKLTAKGYGVAPLPSGQEVEVAHTLPGDEVLVSWKKKRHPPQKGRLLEVVSPSGDRTAPRCAHVGVCGGCCWQQMDYQAQLREKGARVQKAFGAGAPLRPILPCEEPFRYRNKMEFSFSENRGGTRYLGLMIAQAEPYVFNVEECHLCPVWFSLVLQKVRNWWEGSGLKAYYPPADTGTLRYLTLREGVRTGDKMAILNVSGRAEFAPTRNQLDEFVSAVLGAVGEAGPISIFLRVHQTRKGVPTQFYEIHLSGPDHIVEELHLERGVLSFHISPASFFQPNTRQAEKLYDAALSFLEDPAVVYDLYCGTGTLGMAAAQRAQQVIGIDLSPQSILDAEENLKRNQIGNMALYQGDVGKVLSEHRGRFPSADAVIIDPPRAGLDPAALQHLQELKAGQIIYISCNPTTQAENVKELVRSGYRLESLQPVDQFPHTYHIENIALLAR